MYGGDRCNLVPLAAGPRFVFRLDIGAAVRGVLTVSTCGLTTNNTVLYVGTGCPLTAMAFSCRAASDNAPRCGANGLASTVSFTTPFARIFFIQLGGSGGGAPPVSGLSWSYSDASLTASATHTRTTTTTPSRPPSATRSMSRTRKAKK